MTSKEEAKYYRDMFYLERHQDINLRTAVALNVDPSTYLDLRAESYFKVVSKAVLFRLGLKKMLEIIEDSIIEMSDNIYKPNSAPTKKKGKARQLIDKKIKISQVLKHYGLKPKGKKVVCPFHDDKDPSLSFSDEKNVWKCWGCEAKGDIIELVRRLEGVKRNG